MGQLLALVETKTVYKKQSKCTGDIYVIKKHLIDAREDAVRKDNETIDAYNVNLALPKVTIRRFERCSVIMTNFGKSHWETKILRNP